MLLICYGYPNYNTQGAFMIIFFICSDLYNCLRSLCAVAITTENEKAKKKNLHYKHSFRFFDVFPVWPPQKFQVQAKTSTKRPVFSDNLSVSYDYAVKLQTCVTNKVVYFLSSIKDDVCYCTDTPARLQL